MGRRLDDYSLPLAFTYLVPRVKVEFVTDVSPVFMCAFFRPWRSIHNDRGRILRAFVNSDSSPQSIISFTEKYGPVRWQEAFSRYPALERGSKAGVVSRDDGKAITGASLRSFHEGVKSYAFGQIVFSENQDLFRRLWIDASEASALKIEGAGELAFGSGRLTYTTESLEAFLYLSILANRPRLRKCASVDCIAPFFFSRHGPQKYCSNACSESGARAAKRRWWNQNRTLTNAVQQSRGSVRRRGKT